MTEVIRKSGRLRLVVTIGFLTLFAGYVFNFTAPRSFIAPYYLSLRSALLSGAFGVQDILFLSVLILTGLVLFIVPFYFGFLLAYSFGTATSIAIKVLPFVSVLIPAKNQEKDIGRTLDCLLKSNYPKDNMEILVVTSGSTDRTEKICEEFASKGPVKILNEPLQRKGKPAALNLGLASAKGKLVAVYDGDTFTTPETLRNLVTLFVEPSVSAVTGPIQVLNENDNKLTRGTSLENTYYSGAGLLYEIRERLGQGVFLLGRNFAIRTELLRSLGGFEEASLTEDFSLMFKLREQGKRIAFSPKAIAKDLVPPNWNSFLMQRERWATGWNEENAKYMAQTKDKRKAGLGMINFMLYVNLAIFTLLAIVLAPIFWLLGDYLITMACLLTILFTVVSMAVSVHKYGNRRYSLLAYFPVFIFVSLVMFKNAAIRPQKEMEWNQTATE